MKKTFQKSLAVLMLAGWPGISAASERHFTYNYESSVLQAGGKELETYTTYRFGRGSFYSALDQRLEFEMGLGGNAQTALYLNFTQEMLDMGGGNISNQFLADGISNEWKFKLKDSLTDDFGLSLYAEAAFKPDELELETKIIIDKRAGQWLGTFNLTFEPGYHLVDNTAAYSFIPSLGLGVFLEPERFFLGLEFQNDNFYGNNPVQRIRSIFSAGPVLSYTADNWWATLTILPQLANFQGGPLDLSTSQKWQARMALSFSLENQPSSGAVFLPEPEEQDAHRLSEKRGPHSLADLMSGKALYLQRCAACHQIHSPSEFSDEGWIKVMERMQIKARIGDETKESIFNYLMAFSKGSVP